MQKSYLFIGALFASLAVILGAFGAHLLKTKLSTDQLNSFETGVRYQMYHALAIILVYLIGQRINSIMLNYSGMIFIAGIIMFSGSIYLLSCRELFGISGWSRILGPVTPLGGLCFIVGWILLMIASLKGTPNIQ